MRTLLLFCVLISVIGCKSKPKFDKVGDTRTLAQLSVHDPVMAVEDSTYHLFITGMGVAHYASSDMNEWTKQPSCFSALPEWVKSVVPEASMHIWAPDIVFHNGEWHLFYSCSTFGKNLSAIGHATNKTLNPASPDYGWHDTGMVVRSQPSDDDWNAIDPHIAFDENGEPWMSFGSFWGGIQLVKLTDDMSKVDEPLQWHSISQRVGVDGKRTLEGSVEAPFIFQKNGWYYLFVSFDFCCRGVESTYNVVVGRSRDIRGPYIDRQGVSMSSGGGTLVLQGDGEKWVAVGHNAAYTFGERDIFVAHAYEANTGIPRLVVRNIEWDDELWPLIKW